MSSSQGDFVLREEEKSVESKEFDDDDRDFIASEDEDEDSVRTPLVLMDTLDRDRASLLTGVSYMLTQFLRSHCPTDD